MDSPMPRNEISEKSKDSKVQNTFLSSGYLLQLLVLIQKSKMQQEEVWYKSRVFQ